MFLPDISDIQLGSTQVDEIRLGSNLVWELAPNELWIFNYTPSAGTSISVTASFIGTISIDWGDGMKNRLQNGEEVEHAY